MRRVGHDVPSGSSPVKEERATACLQAVLLLLGKSTACLQAVARIVDGLVSCQRAARRRHIRRPGYTLIELVASIAATSILMAGMGSVMFVAARSTDESAAPAMQILASATLHEIVSDLQFAESFIERSSTAVKFSVADRDADSTDETIRYAWSGTPGDPLTRQYGSQAAIDYLDNVHFFAYADHVETVEAFGGTQTHYVYQSDIWLQVGADSSSRVFVAAKTLNAPEVATP